MAHVKSILMMVLSKIHWQIAQFCFLCLYNSTASGVLIAFHFCLLGFDKEST